MVRRESILNLDYLKIEGNNENYIYYGGDQEWFKTAWRRISGLVRQQLQRLLCMKIEKMISKV